MSARDSLRLLEERRLLDNAIVADLRQQLEQSDKKVTAETIAKLLVESEHLTRFQATQLVCEVTEDIEARRAKRADDKMDQQGNTVDDDLLAVDGSLSSDPTPSPVAAKPPPLIFHRPEKVGQFSRLFSISLAYASGYEFCLYSSTRHAGEGCQRFWLLSSVFGLQSVCLDVIVARPISKSKSVLKYPTSARILGFFGRRTIWTGRSVNLVNHY